MLELHTKKCDFPGCNNNHMYGSRCALHGGAGYVSPSDEQFMRHAFNVSEDDRRRYRRAIFFLYDKTWGPAADLLRAGPLWNSSISFKMRQCSQEDNMCVWRISGPDCRVEFWHKGKRINREQARELGAW